MFSNPQTVLMFILAGTTAVVGNILLKAGVNGMGNFNLETLWKMVGNWQIILGFFLYGLSSLLYLKLLSLAEVTKTYPALVAFMTLAVLIMGTVFLKESLTFAKIVGVLVIILGISLIYK